MHVHFVLFTSTKNFMQCMFCIVVEFCVNVSNENTFFGCYFGTHQLDDFAFCTSRWKQAIFDFAVTLKQLLLQGKCFTYWKFEFKPWSDPHILLIGGLGHVLNLWWLDKLSDDNWCLPESKYNWHEWGLQWSSVSHWRFGKSRMLLWNKIAHLEH